MGASNRMALLSKYTQSAKLTAVTRRFAGNVAHHDVVHHDDPHGDHGHGHGHDVVKVDPNHKFIASTDKRFLFFNGLKGTDPATVELENPYRHHNDLPLYQ